MQTTLAKYLLYYPATLAKGELVALHIGKYRKNQYLDPAALRAMQHERAIKLFKFTRQRSAYYREPLTRFFEALQSGQDFEYAYKSIPFLTKQNLIEERDRIATYLKWVSAEKTTGGSTGEPVKLLKNTNALARERAATWRAYEWAGVSIGAPQARFWGVPHDSQQKLKARIIDFISNRKRLSAFNLSSDTLQSYYETLRSFKPKYLYGYVSVLNEFAVYVIENNLPPIPSIASVIATSEVLTEQVRINIQNAFGVQIFNEYGCGEVGSIAHECEKGSMHIMADNLIIETADESDTGELVVTDLFNFSMPLIRYRIGDFGTLTGELCDCGRTLPLIDGIHGRAYDLIQTRSGRRVHPEAIMYVFEDLQKTASLFKQFQVIQLDLDTFQVKIVPDVGWDESKKTLVTEKLVGVLEQNLRIDFEISESISREASGKMRVVKSNLN